MFRYLHHFCFFPFTHAGERILKAKGRKLQTGSACANAVGGRGHCSTKLSWLKRAVSAAFFASISTPPPPPPSTRRTLSRARDHYITVGSRLHGGTNVMTRRRSRSSRGGGGSARGFRGLSAWPGRRQLGRCGAEVRGGDGAGAGARCGAAGGGAP